MTLIATFSPLLLLRAILTLENVPSPMVLPSLYFPMFLGDTISLFVSGFFGFSQQVVSQSHYALFACNLFLTFAFNLNPIYL